MTANDATAGAAQFRSRTPGPKAPARRLKARSRHKVIQKLRPSIPGISMFAGGAFPSVLVRLPSQAPEELRPLIERLQDIESVTPPSVEEFAERAREIRREVYEEHYGRGGKSAKG